jgi:hypothetical protein
MPSETNPFSVVITTAGGAVGSTHALPSRDAMEWFLRGVSAGGSLLHGMVTVSEGDRPLVHFDITRIKPTFLSKQK